MRKHSKDNFHIDWDGKHQHIRRYLVNLALMHKPAGKLPQMDVGIKIINKFRTELRNAGWWPVGLEYNRICRELELAPNGGTGKGNARNIREAIRSRLDQIVPSWYLEEKMDELVKELQEVS